MTDPSLRPVHELVADLQSHGEAGLSAAEAHARLIRDGANALTSAPQEPRWRQVLQQFQDPLVLLLLCAIGVSVVAWWLEGAHGLPLDALVIAVIVVVNAVIGLAQESRAQNAVAALARLTRSMVSVIRGGAVQRVPSEDLVRGDLVSLSEGDSVGADARLLSATNLKVSEASLTGESEPVLKDVVTLTEPAALGDRVNMVFKGTFVTQGVGRALVTATGMRTEMGAIATLLEATEEEPTPLQREIARLGRVLGLAVVLIALVVIASVAVVFGIKDSADAVNVLLLGVSLAVAAVPEGLPTVMSVVLALGVQRMAARRAIVKKLSSVETLGAASVICSDKTGTLTRSEMTIQRVVTASGTVELTGAGYAPEGQVLHAGAALTPGPLLTEVEQVLLLGSLANNATLTRVDGHWEIQGDPTEASFLVAARKLEGLEAGLRRFTRRAELPFTSERKLMSTVHHDAHRERLSVMTKGAPDVLLGLCTHVLQGHELQPLTSSMREEILGHVERLSAEAFRTLAVASRELPAHQGVAGSIDEALQSTLESDLVWVGLVGIIDPPRPEAAHAIAEAHRAGVRVIMMTGDHPATAARIATDLGICEPGAVALSGKQLDALSAADFDAAVQSCSVYARVAPVHKMKIVDALQRHGHIVAMTGDGVNDAPALKAADIGVAMGINGTEVTRESARMILADDNFATLVAAIREGRAIFENIKKFLRYLLSSNMGEVFTVFFGVIAARRLGLADPDGTLELPLLATQILWVNLVTDALPALALGIDPETDDVMSRRPRTIDTRVIDASMWSGILLIGVTVAIATLAAIDASLPGGFIEGSGSLIQARTSGFTVVVLAQMFNVFNSRSETSSATHGLWRNWRLWGAVGLGAALQVAVVHLPPLNRAFSTTALTAREWALCVALSSSVIWVDELRKWVLRRFTAA